MAFALKILVPTALMGLFDKILDKVKNMEGVN